MAARDKPPPSITDPEQIPALLHALRHEVVQPIHTLGLLLDLVPTAGSDKRLAAWSDSGNRALDNLRRMLRTLGDIAKLDLAPPAPTHQDVRPAALFTGLAAAKRDVAELAGVRVAIAPMSRVIRTDPELLRLALDALLDNALRHGGRKVLLGARRRGNRVLIGVWDNGAGLESDEALYCQQDFVRGEQTGAGEERHASLGTGLGLGLGLAQRAAHLMGAEFCFDSRLGKGTAAGLLLETSAS